MTSHPPEAEEDGPKRERGETLQDQGGDQEQHRKPAGKNQADSHDQD